MFWKPKSKYLRSGLPAQDGVGPHPGMEGEEERRTAQSLSLRLLPQHCWSGALERNVIKPSNSVLLSAWQGLRMHNSPRVDYLQVWLGRVKNSISSAQALGTRFHRGGLFLVNKEEMASRFTVITGRGHQFVYILQRKSAWAPQALRQRPRVKEGPRFSERKQVVPQPSGRIGNTGPPQSNLHWRPTQPLLPVTRLVLKLIVFHFLIITLLPHPKPNTETPPSIYQASRRAIKVSVIYYSLPCF